MKWAVPTNEDVYVAEDNGHLYTCPLTERGRRCGKCMRGVFRATLRGASGRCKVCRAEHWIGSIKTLTVRECGMPTPDPEQTP